jgi:methionine-rich copper-binding protein CopC
MTNILKAASISLFIATAFSSVANAHAHLSMATPAADSIVATAPTELDLKFSEDVNLKFSGVKVMGPNKAAGAMGPASLTDGDTTLIVPITDKLAAGTYVVDWHNLSKDGHKSHGTYKFTVKP